MVSNMDKVNTIVQIINTTGFPIFCVLALGLYIKTCQDKLETTITDMKIVIEKNTDVIARICERIPISKEGE